MLKQLLATAFFDLIADMNNEFNEEFNMNVKKILIINFQSDTFFSICKTTWRNSINIFKKESCFYFNRNKERERCYLRKKEENSIEERKRKRNIVWEKEKEST